MATSNQKKTTAKVTRIERSDFIKDRLTSYKQKNNYPVEKMIDILKLSQGNYYDVYAGNIGSRNFDSAVRVAKTLGLSLDVLGYWDEVEKPDVLCIEFAKAMKHIIENPELEEELLDVIGGFNYAAKRKAAEK